MLNDMIVLALLGLNLPKCLWIISDDLCNNGHLNLSGPGIFNADNRRRDRCLNVRFLKTEIGVDHFTINEP